MRKKYLILNILTLVLFIASSFLPLQKALSQPLPVTAEYLTLIQQRISSYFTYPKEAKAKGWEGVAKVKFTIAKDGRVKEIDIAKSSGFPLLDLAAMLAVKDAGPYPSFKLYAGELEELELQVDVAFKRPYYLEKTEPLEKAAEPAKLEAAKASEQRIVPQTTGQFQPKELSEKTLSLEKRDNLDNLINLALESYQPARIAKEQVELAHLKIFKAGRDLFPSFAAEWKKTEGETISDPYRSKSYGVQGEQTVFDSGKLGLTFRREKLGLEIAKKNYAQIKNELAYKVKKGYYELAGAQEILKNLKETKALFEKDLDLVNKQYSAGLITKIEFLNAQAKYERIGYLIDSAEADLSIAKLSLQQALNTDSIDNLEQEVSLDLNVKEVKIDVGQTRELARKSRADIQSLELGDLSAKYAELITARENRPKITLSGSRGKSGESYSTSRLDMSEEWSLMVKVSSLFGGSTLETARIKDKTLPKSISDTTLKTEANTSQVKFSLLNNLAYYTDQKEAKIAHKQVASQLHETMQKADTEIENAYMAYQKAISLLNTALSDKNFRERELEVNLMRRNIAELPTSELMQTRIELVQAKSTYIQAVANYHLSIAGLNKAIGISNYYH